VSDEHKMDRRTLILGVAGAGLAALAVGGEAHAQEKFSPPKNAAEFKKLAAELGKKAKSDRDFAEKLKKDPVKTLEALGIGERATQQLLSDEGILEKHVPKGKINPDFCITSGGCCFTCIITTKKQ
jgi:hypothetical protein